MNPPVLSTRTIKALHGDLLARKFAIPKLQRSFVWDAGRAAKLLDSIYHRMPIGSLFLWEIDRKSAHLIRQDGRALPPYNPQNPLVWFVIDGQQRLSVIHHAFEGSTIENYAGRSIDFGRLCFVVSPDGAEQDPPRIVYRKPQGRELVSVHDILAADWKRRMPSRAGWFMKRVAECRRRLLEYPIPVVTIQRASIAEVGEVFIRLNSQGMRITSVDRAIALMGELDVRLMADEVRALVRQEVFALSGIDPILMGFSLVTEPPTEDGDPPKLEAMARRWSRRLKDNEAEQREFKKLWDRYQRAFLTAVDYLHRRFPVHSEAYLPSANMLATLAVYFYHHQGQPTAAHAAEIRKWFWATGVAERYSGKGYHRNIAADTRFFSDLAQGMRRIFTFRDFLDQIQDVQSAEYASKSARTRAFFCLLASKEPLYLDNGEELPLRGAVVSPLNKAHRHHVFPQAQMKNHFPAKAYNSLCNICFLVARDNASIGMKLPRTYLTEYRNQGGRVFTRVMKSHLIPAGRGSGVWESGLVAAFKQFRAERLRLICAEFEKAAGMKLFRES